MEIVIKRIAKKSTYTIGKLYIDNKYFCDTLEDKDRGLKDTMSVEKILNIKVKHETAIPTGNYNVEVDGNELDNIQKQLDIYKEIVEDTRKQLNLIIELRENDRTTIHKLQATVDSLYPLACQIKICDKRSRLTEKQLNKLSENGDSNKKDN